MEERLGGVDHANTAAAAAAEPDEHPGLCVMTARPLVQYVAPS